MGIKIAINGLGRIGRATLKLVMDKPSIELVAVPRETRFAITGDFYAANLVKALNAAGFSAHVEQ
jgi:glyceraldehyde-3-phosphate dehydrogenase/erythrose-4-phosphate dehydrogenase